MLKQVLVLELTSKTKAFFLVKEKIMLSRRLREIANMVPKCQVMADIGTDHGYLPIALVSEGIVEQAWAMDINEGPLVKATQNIGQASVEDKVFTKRSDGLKHLPDSVQVVVIAGMGGMLIKRILEDDADKLGHLKALVVSPHLDEEVLRRTIHKLGLKIVKETMIEDQGKFYPIMSCQHGHEIYTNIEYKYGKILLEEQVEPWRLHWENEIAKMEVLIERMDLKKTANTIQRVAELQAEINEIKAVIQGEIK